MPTINVLGVPHRYDLTAPTDSSEVLVFVHGWLLSRSYWKPLTEKLAIDHQCLAYDLRGFGDSQPCQVTQLPLEVQSSAETCTTMTLQAPSGYSLQDYAKDLGILLETLNLKNVWLVGHSLGGSIALWAADEMGDRVKGVICMNAGGGIYLKEEFERFRSAGQQIVRMRPRWLCHVPLIDLLFIRASVATAIARSWAKQRLIDFVIADPEAALGTLLDSTTEAEVHRLPQVVARLQQPIYFIAGSSDPIMEPKYVRHLASFHRSFGDCGENVFEIPECGHLAMVEQTDAVAVQIRGILQRARSIS
ncbi:MAG: alpha/beta hydrolase [Leptolyngbyaceae cyanobacterium CSU_1_3]|nr:alpha/beta hydrolase [Leptolyngbyaceae cyanobacterium CSU_1_3]